MGLRMQQVDQRRSVKLAAIFSPYGSLCIYRCHRYTMAHPAYRACGAWATTTTGEATTICSGYFADSRILNEMIYVALIISSDGLEGFRVMTFVVNHVF